MMPGAPIDSVFINGTVGSGKSTLAEALSLVESVPHAIIDLDALRRLVPAPKGDQFNHVLELHNLRSVAANYRAAGARRFILAGVIEDPNEVDKYRTALTSTGMFLIRLTAQPLVLEERLRERHRDDPAELAWHLERVGELDSILANADSDDLVLDSTATSPVELAGTVRRAAGWDRDQIDST